jgi:hypothetical protein
MPKLDLERHRSNYNPAIRAEGAIYLERPALFSSAAAAQDSANQSRMPWSWAGLAEGAKSMDRKAHRRHTAEQKMEVLKEADQRRARVAVGFCCTKIGILRHFCNLSVKVYNRGIRNL